MEPTPTTHRLLSLAPEIRAQIFELWFFSINKTVDLARSQPPSKALLLTCRRVYQEARLMHREAYRAYWERTTFHLQMPENESTELGELGAWMLVEDVRASLAKVGRDDLAHIKSLRLLFDGEDVWAYDDGVWTLWCLDDARESTVLEYSEIWFLEGLDAELRKAGFSGGELCTGGWCWANVTGESAERIEVAKAMAIKRHGLSIEELLCALLE